MGATQQVSGVTRQVFALLSRYRIEPSPANFELAFEIVSGNNPELRKRFVELGDKITPAAMEALGKAFLPHHFGDSIYEKSSTSIRSELGGFHTLLSGSQSALNGFSAHLKSAVDRLGRIDPGDTRAICLLMESETRPNSLFCRIFADTKRRRLAAKCSKAIRSEIDGVVRVTNEHNAHAGQVLEQVGRHMAAVDGLNREIDEVLQAKFVHSTTGLGNRRAFNRQMAELYTSGRVPRDCSLITGRIANFNMFQQPKLVKAKEMVLAGFGSFAQQAMQPGDFGFWLETPDMVFLIDVIKEDELRAFIDRLRNNLTQQLKAVGCSAAALESLTICFGSANTRSSDNVAGLIRNSEAALGVAVATGESRTVFHVMMDKSGEGKDYHLYGRRDFTV